MPIGPAWRTSVRRIPLPLAGFTIAGLLAGALFLRLEAPVSTFDAAAHYFRAAQIARGQWRAIVVAPGKLGALLPRPQVAFARHEPAPARAAEAEYAFVDFTGAAVYSPLNYAPQVLGMTAAGAFGLDPLATYRISCVFNLATYLALLGGAIWLLPGFWPVFVSLGLAPEIVRQAASQHPDAINIGVIALFAAVVLRSAERTDALSRRSLLALAGLGVLLALLKPAASVFLCLLLALPSRSFGGRLRHAGFLLLVLAANVAVLAAWYHPYIGLNIAATHGLAGDPHQQEAALLAQPSMFLQVLAHALPGLRDDWAQNFAFIHWPLEKAYFDATYLWNPAARVALWVTLASAVAASARPALRARAACVLAAAASFSAIVLVMWVVAGKVGAPDLVRIQGRYFLPAFLALGCALPGPWPKRARPWRWVRGALFAAVVLLLFRTLAAVARYSLV